MSRIRKRCLDMENIQIGVRETKKTHRIINTCLDMENYVLIGIKENTQILKQVYGNDTDYALEMFRTYIEIIGDDLLLIKDSIKTNNIISLQKQLHRIKPAFTMVGISEITKTIETVEPNLESLTNSNLEIWFKEFEW